MNPLLNVSYKVTAAVTKSQIDGLRQQTMALYHNEQQLTDTVGRLRKKGLTPEELSYFKSAKLVLDNKRDALRKQTVVLHGFVLSRITMQNGNTSIILDDGTGYKYRVIAEGDKFNMVDLRKKVPNRDKPVSLSVRPDIEGYRGQHETVFLERVLPRHEV